MRPTLLILLIVLAASPILFAKAHVVKMASVSAQVGTLQKSVSIAWTGLPEGTSLEMGLAHPEAYLHKFTVEELGQGQGRIHGNMAAILTRAGSKRVELLSLDHDLFELRDKEGFWSAMCI